jgi:hypothetical protein
LGAGLGFCKVAEAEAPMSKILIPLPKFVIVKLDDEGGEEFVVKVAAHANMLVGHNALVKKKCRL